MSETLLAELQNDEITIIDQTPLRPLSVNLRELLPPSSDLRPPATLKKNRFNNLNLIRVDDTPSPILSRKFKSKNAKKKAKSTTKKSQTPKRLKKLLDANSQGVVNDLPGCDDLELSANKPTQLVLDSGIRRGTKYSGLFKPRSKLNDQEDTDGCDLSLNSLQRLQRRRNNPLIVRLSEIFNNFEAVNQQLAAHIDEPIDTAANPTQTPNRIDELITDMVTTFFNDSNNLTKVTQLIENSFSEVLIKQERLEQTSRFEYTENYLAEGSEAFTKTNEGDKSLSEIRFNELFANLEVGEQMEGRSFSLASQFLRENNDDEEISSSPIVVHPTSNSLPNYDPSSTMFLLLKRIDQIFESLKGLQLKPTRKSLNLINKSINMAAESNGPKSNLVNELLTEMVTSYFSETNHLTQVTQLAHTVKKEPPDLTSRLEYTLNCLEASLVPPFDELCIKDENFQENIENIQVEANQNPTEVVEPKQAATSKKVKKLLATNAFLDENETLPGSYDMERDERMKKNAAQQKQTKFSGLFKPKNKSASNLAAIEDLSERQDEPQTKEADQVTVKTEARDQLLINKTNQLSKKLFKRSDKLAKSLSHKRVKKVVLSHLNLKSEDAAKLKETAKQLVCQVKIFSKETTHLLVDFEQEFVNKQPELKTKLILLMAALNGCKIVRLEWLAHSSSNQAWLDEEKYLLENYLSEELSNYDELEFDVKLVQLIRRLNTNEASNNYFSCFSNIFVIRERTENKTNPAYEISVSDMEEEEPLKAKRHHSPLSYWLRHLVVKCGGQLTNNPFQAELMIAIDRTGDYDEENKRDANKIKMDQKYFLNCIKKLKCVISSDVQVISSEWILDCILEGSNLDRDEFSLINLQPD